MKELAFKIIAMAKRDRDVRDDLIRRRELFDGYHPEMEAVHNENADELSRIIDSSGWPTEDVVGKDAAEAAWLVAQHAISKPEFQKRCLSLMKSSQAVDPIQLAQLEDRIAVFLGEPQIFGTQFDWYENGLMSPAPIRDPSSVDTLRAQIGLPTLKESLAKIRERTAAEGGKPPSDLAARKADIAAWAKRVGWRK